MSEDRVEKAWREYLDVMSDGDPKRASRLRHDVDRSVFADGFLAGLADALTMPEVRADELEEGKNFPQEGVTR